MNIVRIPADGAEVLITSERPLSTAAWAAVAEIAEAATRLTPGTAHHCALCGTFHDLQQPCPAGATP